jgi:hypothetical protein
MCGEERLLAASESTRLALASAPPLGQAELGHSAAADIVGVAHMLGNPGSRPPRFPMRDPPAPASAGSTGKLPMPA